jgi:hypothetical protein
VNYLIVIVMSLELEKHFMGYTLDAYEIMRQLKKIFQKKACEERYEAIKTLMDVKYLKAAL